MICSGHSSSAAVATVAGDRKLAPYFLLNKEGKDVEGYTLHLYPAICRRHYVATHAITYTGALMPTTAHPIWKKEPQRARYVTFPSAKAYSKKEGSDSAGMTYKFVEAILRQENRHAHAGPSVHALPTKRQGPSGRGKPR
jgi:hypothetical protein